LTRAGEKLQNIDARRNPFDISGDSVPEVTPESLIAAGDPQYGLAVIASKYVLQLVQVLLRSYALTGSFVNAGVGGVLCSLSLFDDPFILRQESSWLQVNSLQFGFDVFTFWTFVCVIFSALVAEDWLPEGAWLDWTPTIVLLCFPMAVLMRPTLHRLLREHRITRKTRATRRRTGRKVAKPLGRNSTRVSRSAALAAAPAATAGNGAGGTGASSDGKTPPKQEVDTMKAAGIPGAVNWSPTSATAGAPAESDEEKKKKEMVALLEKELAETMALVAEVEADYKAAQERADEKEKEKEKAQDSEKAKAAKDEAADKRRKKPGTSKKEASTPLLTAKAASSLSDPETDRMIEEVEALLAGGGKKDDLRASQGQSVSAGRKSIPVAQPAHDEPVEPSSGVAPSPTVLGNASKDAPWSHSMRSAYSG